MKNYHAARFCSHIRMLLSSGMPLLPALKTVANLLNNKDYSSRIERVVKKVSEGYSLSEAAVDLLPIVAVNSIKTAERSGKLEVALESLVKYYEGRAELEEKIKSALVYPIFVLALSFLVVCAVFLFVLPAMKTVFIDLGADLPLLTRIIFSVGDWLGWGIVGLVIFGILLSLKMRKMSRMRIDGCYLKTPLIRKELVIQSLGTLGSLLESGTPIIEALEATATSVNNIAFGQIILQVRDRVENGSKLSKALEESSFFSPEVIQMLEVGEKSGQMAEMLLSIADFQAKERDAALKRYTTLLEPALMLSVGLVVGLVVLAMFLPLLSMISHIN